MKPFPLLLMVALGPGGLARADDFEDLRAKVQAKLPEGSSCEPIQKSDGQAFFGIKIGENRFNVTVHRCDVLSQEAWNAKFREGEDNRKRIMEKAFLRLGDKNWEALIDFQRLPQGRYGNTGVRIVVVAPEADYPDLQKDAARIWPVCKAVQSLLVLYDPEKANSMLVQQW